MFPSSDCSSSGFRGGSVTQPNLTWLFGKSVGPSEFQPNLQVGRLKRLAEDVESFLQCSLRCVLSVFPPPVYSVNLRCSHRRPRVRVPSRYTGRLVFRTIVQVGL